MWGCVPGAVVLAIAACVGDDPGSNSSPPDGAVDDASTGSDVSEGLDSTAPDDAGSPRCDPTKPFVAEEVTELNGVVSNAGARLSRDELTVYWHRADGMSAAVPPTTLWVAKRASRDGVFSSLQPVVGIEKTDASIGDLFPTFLPNGDMLFHTNRGNFNAPRDVYVSRFVGGTFTAPAPFPPLATATFGERAPYVSLDGKEIFLMMDNTDAGASSRLAVSLETSPGMYGQPQLIMLPGSAGTTELSPVISADRLTLYFARGAQMYSVSRTAVGAPWGMPQPITELNVADAASQPTWISEDGCVLYFHSNRPASNLVSRIFRGVRPK